MLIRFLIVGTKKPLFINPETVRAVLEEDEGHGTFIYLTEGNWLVEGTGEEVAARLSGR